MRLVLNRRDWLRIGIPGVLGTLPACAATSGGGPGFGRAKSVLIVYTSGGMSQFESWDPKPNAPAEIRGAFGSIATTVPNLRFGEYLPLLAQRAKQLRIVRSMTHDHLDHGSAIYHVLTGRPHAITSGNPLPSPRDEPTLGSLLKRVRPDKRLPHTAVHLNAPVLAPLLPSAGQNGGFLGRAFEPFAIEDVTDPEALDQGFHAPADVSPIRLDSRRSLLSQLDPLGKCAEATPTADRTAMLGQAYDLLAAAGYRDAFDLTKEPDRVRDRYGRNRAGQACLLARRLVEVGVPFVTAFFNHTIRGQDVHPESTDAYGWDTHNDIFESLKTHLLPRFDVGFSALLDDLQQRGLLDTTLVVCMGEFGRAPIVAHEARFAGRTPGRKHWAACYSIALAGTGIQTGGTFGTSDRIGAYPQENPVTPGDLSATIFHALGIDPSTHYRDLADRPQALATGRPVTALWG